MTREKDGRAVERYLGWALLLSTWVLFYGFGIIVGAEGFGFLDPQPAIVGWALLIPAAVVGCAAQLTLFGGGRLAQ